MRANKRDIVEFIGIFAVVASLIFVGMQLRLDHKTALADQYFNRAESAKADRRSLLESDDYMQAMDEWWALGNRPPWWDEDWELAKLIEKGKFSVRGLEALILSRELSILGYDSVYFQYQQGLLDEETWHGLRSALKNTMATYPLARAVYKNQARRNLQPVIEDILREIDAERKLQQRSE